MKQYLDLLQRIMDEGVDKGDRTGTGTRSVFGHQLRCDLSQGFPLLTTKKVFLRGIIHELLWMLSGDKNILLNLPVYCEGSGDGDFLVGITRPEAARVQDESEPGRIHHFQDGQRLVG